jgi:hypothetical protein
MMEYMMIITMMRVAIAGPGVSSKVIWPERTIRKMLKGCINLYYFILYQLSIMMHKNKNHTRLYY